MIFFLKEEGVRAGQQTPNSPTHPADPEAEVQREEPSLMSVREKQGPGFLAGVEMSHTTQHTR